MENILDLTIDPSRIQAGGGFTQEELQPVAVKMKADAQRQFVEDIKLADETFAKVEAMKEQVRLRQEERDNAIKTDVAAIAKAAYEQAAKANPQLQQERFAIESAKNRQLMAAQGRKGGQVRYDPIMGTLTNEAPTTFDTANAERVTEIKQFAGISATGGRVVTPYFETEAYTGKKAAPAKPTGEDIMASSGPALTLSLRKAMEASPGGQMALQAYNERLSGVVTSIQDNLANLQDEFGQVEPKALADYAASLPGFDMAMAPDVKRAITVISAQMNEKALAVKQFKLQEARLAQDQEQFEFGKQQEAIKNSTYAQAVGNLAGTRKEGQKEVPTEAGRLMQGGMTAAEVVMYSMPQDTIRDEAYKGAKVDQIAKFIMPDADFGETAAVAETEGEMAARAQVVEGSLDAAYNKARTMNADIRESMTIELAKEIGVQNMPPAEAMFFINDIWNKADTYTKERVAADAANVRAQQTARVASQVNLVATELAIDAAQNRAAAFDPVMKSEGWKNAGGNPMKLRGVLLGGFVDQLVERTGAIFDTLSPQEAADLEQTYNKYQNYLGSAEEARLAEQDPNFANIVRAKDAYIQAGLALAKTKDDEYMLKRQEVEMAKASNPAAANYDVVRVGDKPYALPVARLANLAAYESSVGFAVEESEERGEIGVKNLVQKLQAYGDNPYIQQLLDANSTNGVFQDSPEVLRRLTQIVLPPTKEIMDRFPDTIRGSLSAYYANLPPKSLERSVLGSDAPAFAAGELPVSPYSTKEYEERIGPAATEVAKAEKGGELEALTTALAPYQQEGAKSAQQIVTENSALRQMFAAGGDTRDKAVAIAYMKMRDAAELSIVTKMVGGKNFNNQDVAGVAQRLDFIYSNGVDGTPSDHAGTVRSLRDFGDQAKRVYTNEEIMELSREAFAFERRAEIGMLKRMVKEYDAAIKSYGEQYGRDGLTPEMANKVAWNRRSTNDGLELMKQLRQQAQEVIDAHTYMVSAISQQQSGIARQGRTPAPIAGVAQQFR